MFIAFITLVIMGFGVYFYPLDMIIVSWMQEKIS